MTNGDLDVVPTIGWICLDSTTPEVLAAWWSRLLGGGATRTDQDGDVHLQAGPMPLLFLKVAEPKASKNRMHLDLRVANYEEAVARALSLGATSAPDIYRGDDWTVLRDPEGNEFCIIRPRPEK
jgi:Glyoxalase-like domain